MQQPEPDVAATTQQPKPAAPQERQEVAGPYGENGFLEDYTARVRGEGVGNVVLVTRNAAGQAQRIVANYRPRKTLLLLSRLIGEHLAGTPYGEHFASSAPE